MDIKEKFDSDVCKKIFWNSNNKLVFISEFWKILNKKFLSKKSVSSKELDEIIVNNRNYEIAKDIIRSLFKNSIKYKRWKEADEVMQILVDEWKKLNLWNVERPFSQGDFDGFVQRINQLSEKWEIKDEKVKIAAVKFRRLKEINTLRNDFLETLIFEKNKNIIPTLNHTRWVDFFIDGIAYDQKVSRSPTNEFKKYYWEHWKTTAIQQPELVAKYLYTYQDEWRFGADERLLIVYLDENISVDLIQDSIDKINLESPLEINFSYIHNKWKPTEKEKNYKVKCFCILLVVPS
jgi:hypothetical protein